MPTSEECVFKTTFHTQNKFNRYRQHKHTHHVQFLQFVGLVLSLSTKVKRAGEVRVASYGC